MNKRFIAFAIAYLVVGMMGITELGGWLADRRATSDNSTLAVAPISVSSAADGNIPPSAIPREVVTEIRKKYLKRM